jgi:hypothetical protein
MWPSMAAPGTGATRLRTALGALLDVADRHLHLLGVSDDVFERADERMRDITGQTFSFLDPIVAALRTGVGDGTLDPGDTTVEDAAAGAFAAVCWGYVHLRRRSGWAPERARRVLLEPTLAGLAAR